jgi:hypothetical protein
METLILFIAIASTVYFLNDKFSKAVRVIAFKESEDEKGAKISFCLMILIIIVWTVYFSLF